MGGGGDGCFIFIDFDWVDKREIGDVDDLVNSEHG